MPQHLSGGCQCGAVRFQAATPLGEVAICHCRMCQKAFGSFGAILVTVPLKNFKWTRGCAATFKSSPLVSRGFCAACGTPLFMFEEGDSNIDVAAGAFDTPNVLGPLVEQIGSESKLAWFDTMHTLPHRTTDATRTPEELRQLISNQHPDQDTVEWP